MSLAHEFWRAGVMSKLVRELLSRGFTFDQIEKMTPYQARLIIKETR